MVKPYVKRQLDLTAVFIALIAGVCSAIPATIIAWNTKSAVMEKAEAINVKVDQVAEKVEVIHKATNSLTEQLVESTASDSLQKGRTQGAADEKSRAAGKVLLPDRYDAKK